MLHILKMQRVAIYNTERSYMKVIDFTHLKGLTLIWCPGDSQLLQSLATLFETKGSSLKTFDFTGNLPRHGVVEHFLKACDPFLDLFLLCWHDRDLKFDYASLRKHLSSVMELGLSFPVDNEEEHQASSPLPHAALESLAQHCTDLEEIALAMPATSDSLTGEYEQCLIALCKCPTLRVLRIFNLPTAPRG